MTAYQRRMQPLVSKTLIRVVALMESPWGSGPAKNLIEFARRAAQPQNGMPPVYMTVVTYHRGGGENPLVVNARKLGIDAIALTERGSFDRNVIPELERVVARCGPDILQSHNIKSHFLVRLTGLHRRYPWVAFNHGYTAINWKDRLYRHIDRWSLRAAYRVVAVCGPFARRLMRRGVSPDSIRVQHNSVQPFVPPGEEEIAALKTRLGLTSELVVLCVGRLSFEKGHADLLEAIAMVRSAASLPEFRLVLVGDGPERERIIEQARRLTIEHLLVMPGHQPDMRAYYAIATLLALPSHTEGSPNVVLEAMAAGVPIAGTTVGGVPEMLDDGETGLLVPPRAPAAMATALKRLLENSRLRIELASAARRQIDLRFTPEAYRQSLVSLYQEILASREPRPFDSTLHANLPNLSR
jgi:glycosyltransferase involved in cell wall biosynthesis